MSSPDSISPTGPPPPEIAPSPAARSEDPPWNLADVLLTAIFALISLNIVVAIAVGIARSTRWFRGTPPQDLLSNGVIEIPVLMVTYLFIVGFMVQIVRLRHGAELMSAIAWNPPDRKTGMRALAGGLGLAILSQVVGVLLARWTPPSLPVERLFQQSTSAYIASAFGVLVAPVVEELFFRGFLYPALARRTGMAAAICLTALAFTMLHGAQLAYAWAPLVPILIVGLILTIIRAVSRSLALSVLTHMAYNGTVLTVALIGTHGFHRLPPP